MSELINKKYDVQSFKPKQLISDTVTLVNIMHGLSLGAWKHGDLP